MISTISPPEKKLLMEAGQRFNLLTFIEEAGWRGRRRMGLFKCNCGNEKEIDMYLVRGGYTKSCGCYAQKKNDLRYFNAQQRYRYTHTQPNRAGDGAEYVPVPRRSFEVAAEKQCSGCGQTKPLGEFRKKPSADCDTISSRVAKCRDCEREKEERREARLQGMRDKKEERWRKKEAKRLAEIQKEEDAERFKEMKRAMAQAAKPKPFQRISTPIEPIRIKPEKIEADNAMQPFSLSIMVNTPEAAMELYRLGYVTTDMLVAAGLNKPEVGSREWNDAKKKMIQEAIQEYFGYDFNHLKRKTRKRKILFPRQLSIYLLATYTKLSLYDIGTMYGGVDHTFAIHARDVVIGYLTQKGYCLERERINDFLSIYNFD